MGLERSISASMCFCFKACTNVFITQQNVDAWMPRISQIWPEHLGEVDAMCSGSFRNRLEISFTGALSVLYTQVANNLI